MWKRVLRCERVTGELSSGEKFTGDLLPTMGNLVTALFNPSGTYEVGPKERKVNTLGMDHPYYPGLQVVHYYGKLVSNIEEKD